jgi:HK97 family phage major capsid protein
MRSVKVLTEECELARDKAHAIYETAMSEGRDFTDEEDAEFKRHAQNYETLSHELTLARMHETELKSRGANMGNDYRPQMVLPTDGRAPGDERPTQVTLRTHRLRSFRTEREAYLAGQWLKAIVARTHHNLVDERAERYCKSNGLEIMTASYESSGPAGGYLVPAPIAQTIIDVRENVGIARQVCNVQPMTAETMTVPKRAGGLTVYYGAENPSSDMTDSDKTWDQIELITRKRYVVSKISQELSDDALISIVDNIISEMAYALALQEDNELINGDGTSTYGLVRGLRNLVGSAGTLTADTGDSTWDTLDLDDFTGAMGKLPDRYNRNPVWICSSNFYYTAMLNILATHAGNGIVALQSGDNGRRQFLGYPVFFTSQMPTSTAVSQICALFGDFRMGVLLGDRTGVRIQRDDSVDFLRDMITLKATTRYDIRVHEPGDSSNPGCYIALKTSAS